MKRILVTGAMGAVGQVLLREISVSSAPVEVIATDIRLPDETPDNIRWERMDVQGTDPERVIGQYRPDVVIHLASIVTPPAGMTREEAFAVDVTGTHNILAACAANNVKRLVVTSSGAAYGYHADNPALLKEGDALRGNVEFAYSDHKRQVEEMLAAARSDGDLPEQVIFRVGTVLGAGVENQITALFRRKRILGISGSESPFVFITPEDLARILLRAVTDGPAGIYNVAGDGAVGTSDLAKAMGKPVLWLPAWFLKGVLAVARPLGLSRYGPEQVRFLQFRPVLDNTRLKKEFGYIPQMTSAEAFAKWVREAKP